MPPISTPTPRSWAFLSVEPKHPWQIEKDVRWREHALLDDLSQSTIYQAAPRSRDGRDWSPCVRRRPTAAAQGLLPHRGRRRRPPRAAVRPADRAGAHQVAGGPGDVQTSTCLCRSNMALDCWASIGRSSRRTSRATATSRSSWSIRAARLIDWRLRAGGPLARGRDPLARRVCRRTAGQRGQPGQCGQCGQPGGGHGEWLRRSRSATPACTTCGASAWTSSGAIG